MDSLIIKPTESTPDINFDFVTGIMEISGRSLPEDAKIFYAPIINWLTIFKQTSHTSAVVLMKLDYFNTASSKIILDIFQHIEEVSNEKKIVWHYNSDDDDMLEAGEEFEKMINVPFEYISY